MACEWCVCVPEEPVQEIGYGGCVLAVMKAVLMSVKTMPTPRLRARGRCVSKTRWSW